jgi:aminodeoxychorismate lyase
MTVFLNGHFMPEDQARVSVWDRCFLYGDGLFETVRLYKGQAFRWRAHFERLRLGAEFLGLPLPCSAVELEEGIRKLAERNGLEEGVVRVTVSRGTGERGYSPRTARSPLVAMQCSPLPGGSRAPNGWRLVVASGRVFAGDPLLRHKTCNKLIHVLARGEADQKEADEALLVNDQGYVTEATSANIFWIQGDGIGTPPIRAGLLPGVTRALVMEYCAKAGLHCFEELIFPEALAEADGVFLTSSVIEIAEVGSIEGQKLRRSPLVSAVQNAYREWVAEG